MKDEGSITPADAMKDLGVYRLASRICDLKRAGVGIITQIEVGKDRYGEVTRYARYRLEDN
jgi:hypothetical protein